MDQVSGMVTMVRKAGMAICGSSQSMRAEAGEHEGADEDESGGGGEAGDGSDERGDEE